ncbi:MAG TPA: YceI family protein [Gaiellaceae bacterium]|nr:YceI family protein [Gaiellaceae bacterium]
MTTTQQQTTALPTGTWELDGVHSSIGFAVRHSGVMTFRGTFGDYDARIADGRLEGRAQVASVQVDDENLAAHLQSPDFFDAERHPEIRFSGRETRLDGDRITIAGELTVKGETRPVELVGVATGPVVDGYGKNRLGLDLEARIDRNDFGVSWNAELPTGDTMLDDEVVLTANLALVEA